jgi:hypothetical protein
MTEFPGGEDWYSNHPAVTLGVEDPIGRQGHFGHVELSMAGLTPKDIPHVHYKIVEINSMRRYGPVL